MEQTVATKVAMGSAALVPMPVTKGVAPIAPPISCAP